METVVLRHIAQVKSDSGGPMSVRSALLCCAVWCSTGGGKNGVTVHGGFKESIISMWWHSAAASSMMNGQ